MTPGDGGPSAAAPATPRRGARLRAVFAAVFVLLAAAFAANEWVGERERTAAGDAPTVSLDVDPARADLAARLLELELRCATIAQEALDAAGDGTDRSDLFALLAAIDLPPSAGVQLADSEGRLLAWAGTSVPELDTTPFPGNGAVLVDTVSSRRLAAQRTRLAPTPGAAARAVCHLPFEVRHPLAARVLESWSLLDDVRARHRVGAITVRASSAPDDGAGTSLASAWGGEFARLDVQPLSRRAWDEKVAEDVERRRAQLLAATVLAAAAAAWTAARGFGTRRPAAAALVRAGVVAALRLALAFVPASRFAGASDLTRADAYAHGLPLALAASPADLVLTCGAVLWIADCLRRAAQAARRRATGAAAGVVGVLAAAAVVRLGWGALVADVVANSTVEFLPDVTVLPHSASAVLLASILAAGIASVLLVAAAWEWLGPAHALRPSRLAALAVAAGAIAAPLGPPGTPGDGILAAAAVAGLAAALGAMLADAGTALRAGVVPLAVAVAAFTPLERHVVQSVRDDVAAQAQRRVASRDRTDRIVVEATLDRLESSEELGAAVRARRVQREMLQRLWSESPLAARPGGSMILIEPFDPVRGDIATRKVAPSLPPVPWLPGATTWPRLGEIGATPLPGRGPGRDGRWLVGSRRLLDGPLQVANLWVVMEVQAPSNAGLPELEVLEAGAGTRRRAPRLTVSRYGPGGALEETNDAYRAAGARLSRETRDEAVGSATPVWVGANVAGRDLAAVVVAQTEGGVATGFHAFSFDTGGVRRLLLRGARAALCGALLGALALAATLRRWARGPRLRLAHRMVLSYVVVSGLPLLLLGVANRELARQRADDQTETELRKASSLLAAEFEQWPGSQLPLRIVEQGDVERSDNVREVAYRTGHHANVFWGQELLASSDDALFDTDLQPHRLPGPVYREILLLGRPFHAHPARVGEETFDVGYAPLRTNQGEIVGAVSVPLLHQGRLRDSDLADGVTAILALYLACLVLAVAVGTWLAARLTRPLRDLTTATQRVAAGDLSRPVPEAGPGELGEVVGAFNRMMRDLTESRERLVRAEKEAAWRDMARQVAHEVKNPLTPMRLAAEHLRRAWRDDVPQFGEMLERSVDLIVRQTESLKRIATSFSDFARLPGRRRDPTDVADAVRRVAHLYENTPRLTVRADVAEALPQILADPDELHRVLVNLAKNAVEAMEGRDGTLSLRLRRDADDLVLDVEDDGPGIPDEVRARLFEPYFSTKTSGTGLGLAICRRAIEDLGGTIGVRSEAGRGTTFTVRIPVRTRES